MRKTYFDAANKFEPYSSLYDAGATPDQVKEAIVALLQPYVPNESKLRELAVSALATDAVCVGQLSSRPDWKALLDLCFDIRECAIRTNEHLAFEVISYFEPAIRAAQANYALLVVFEVPKDELVIDEYAFDLIRTIGIPCAAVLFLHKQGIHQHGRKRKTACAGYVNSIGLSHRDHSPCVQDVATPCLHSDVARSIISAMNTAAKLLQAMRGNPLDWQLAQLQTVARQNGIDWRHVGTSHCVFVRTDGKTLPVPARRPIKPIYVKKFLELVEGA